MKFIAAVLLAAAIACPIAFAAKAEKQGDVTSKLRHLATGISSGFRKAGTVVAGDDVAYRGMWKTHTANVSPAPALPAVDFKKEMVVGIFDGDKPTGGYTVSVKQVVITPKVVKVRVASTKPAKGAMAAEMITQPFDIIAIPKSAAPVQREAL